jgi:hypothetical protein
MRHALKPGGFSRRTSIVAGAAVLTAVAAIPTALVAQAPPAAAATAAATATISVSAAGTGTSLANSDVGLSYEASFLALPGFGQGDQFQFLKNLGTSVIRIGGNQVDKTFWTSSNEPQPSWADATITPADLNALATLANASGWKVVLGVNMKQYDPARAADEASHAQAALGSSLQDIEIGNEPDLYPQYSGNSGKYVTDFHAYVQAIRAAVPGVPIEGSDAATSPTGALQTAFVNDQASMGQSIQISELTSHHYPLSNCGSPNPAPSIADLLSSGTHSKETSAADSAVSVAKRLSLPAVIDEGNSVVCSGVQGVSDVYASALWAVDEELNFAQEGAAGYYMHGTVTQCYGSSSFPYYTPLCAATAADAAGGNLSAQPEYYGLAAVHAVGTGNFLQVNNPAAATVRAYAVQHADNSVTVVLDNVADPAGNGATTVQLNLPQTYATASRFDLSAASLSTQSGIALGGQTVQSDGTLPAPTTTSYPVGSTSFSASVPAGDAAMITFAGPSGAAPTTFVGGPSGKCLSVTGGATAPGTTSDIYTCNGSPSEHWLVNGNGTITGAYSGLCLEVQNSATADRSIVGVNSCNGAANQRWTVSSGAGAARTIVGTQSGKCLSVYGASTANYAEGEIYTCNGSTSENWTEQP